MLVWIRPFLSSRTGWPTFRSCKAPVLQLEFGVHASQPQWPQLAYMRLPTGVSLGISKQNGPISEKCRDHEWMEHLFWAKEKLSIVAKFTYAPYQGHWRWIVVFQRGICIWRADADADDLKDFIYSCRSHCSFLKGIVTEMSIIHSYTEVWLRIPPRQELQSNFINHCSFSNFFALNCAPLLPIL